ncbi:MAG: hypothetical protein K8S22_15160 [Betaproteobacteria bacterium]|nr:hypothetical protein [Betaproteobacteria bacterium]
MKGGFWKVVCGVALLAVAGWAGAADQNEYFDCKVEAVSASGDNADFYRKGAQDCINRRSCQNEKYNLAELAKTPSTYEQVMKYTDSGKVAMHLTISRVDGKFQLIRVAQSDRQNNPQAWVTTKGTCELKTEKLKY